jgi:hypothetical protein
MKNFVAAFSISDRASCERAIKNGGIAAMISAGITGVFAVIGLFTSSSNKRLAYMLDPWLLVDAGFIVVLGIFIFKKSRIASTLMVLYFITSKIIVWHDIGVANLAVAAIFFLAYFTAMRATFIWRSTYKNAPESNVANAEVRP